MGGQSAMAVGFNLIYYSQFTNGSLFFRPEIGFGAGPMKIVYGYNAHLARPTFDGINTHQVGITYCLALKKLKRKYRRTGL